MRIVNYVFGIFSVISGIMFIYFLYNPNEMTNGKTLALLMVVSMIYGVLFITTEKHQPEHIKLKGSGLVAILLVVFIIIVSASSCSTTGYGCKGTATWKGTVKRINRPY